MGSVMLMVVVRIEPRQVWSRCGVLVAIKQQRQAEDRFRSNLVGRRVHFLHVHIRDLVCNPATVSTSANMLEGISARGA